MKRCIVEGLTTETGVSVCGMLCHYPDCLREIKEELLEKHTVTIKHGKVTIAVEGVKGSGCQAATAELEKKLGRKVADQDTDEMYLTPDTTITQG